ncbi:MAG: phosphoglucosamine mutase [Oscillospiraceae bacterium]
MGSLFGTDGIRGVAGEFITIELAASVGRAAAAVLKEAGFEKPLVVVGKDTRISSDMLDCSITSGLLSSGADVISLGVMPTPAVAYLTVLYKAAAGIVISASHNSFEHNGIKIFGGNGCKLPDELENRIEDYVLGRREMPEHKAYGAIGRILRPENDPHEEYVSHLLSAAEGRFSGLRVLVDCSNGAASFTAPALFARLDLKADIIFASPDGININAECGSTQLNNLRRGVIEGGYDLGIAFDGDADRCLIIDEKGNTIDGDKIMGLTALHEKSRRCLPGDTIVATVMSNLGLHHFCREHGIRLICTSVGDRNVLETMLEGGYLVGGEQSGHLIFRRFATTGDGQLAALRFLSVLSESGLKASGLGEKVPQYPQEMVNIRVTGGNEEKARIMESDALRTEIEACECELNGNGRILVRPSGTEPLIRVMVEAETTQKALYLAQRIANSLR